jgi:hypothetical protein
MEAVKYPRTCHLPWSEGMTSDDKMIKSLDAFRGRRVIVTEKMDGENTTMTTDKCYARSIDSGRHESRSMVKSLWSQIRYDIPGNWRVCGENLYAKHSIHYTNLKSFFLGFSMWRYNNVCMNWGDTLVWFGLLNITPVKVLYDGIFDETILINLAKEMNTGSMEGYVVRVYDDVEFHNFGSEFAKYVRSNHVQTDKHWMNQEIVPNILK